MRRPALTAALYFSVGIGIGHRWSLPAELLTTMSACVLLIALVGLRRGARWTSVVLVSLVVLLGVVRMEVATERLPRHHLLRLLGRAAEADYVGRVAEEPQWDRQDLKVLLEVEGASFDGVSVPACGEALVRFRKVRPDLDYGDRVRLRLRLRRPEPARNPGAFNYRDFLERKGIYGIGVVRRPDQILGVVPGEGGLLWQSIVLPLRRLIRRAIDKNLSGGPAGLLKGMLLGEKRSVPEPVRQAFTDSGVNHVLAVSGLHVGLIAAAAFFVCRGLGMGRAGTGVATVIVLVVYAAVTRLPPSVLRACAMASAAILGALIDRDGEGINVLGAAGLGILAWRPRDLFDIGFQLSFAATGAILLLYRPICALLPLGSRSTLAKWVWVPLSVSLAAQLGTAPLVV
ncbi:MAG: ComEC/Rec2 family competence protein, partial [Candidatus Latescibacteria bacterium]|nr:ComEC/Rec2 family competence protein [Candidatus Latescibacterota bacterium]